MRRLLPTSSGSSAEHTRRALRRLQWLTTIVPAVAAVLYETVRHSLLEQVLPTSYGNIIVGIVVLILAYGFSKLVFREVEQLQAETNARSRDVAALTAIVTERERLGRELHDGLAQMVAYLLVRLDTVSELIASGRLAAANQELEGLHEAADALYGEIRESISGLRMQVAERGLTAALTDYSLAFTERHGVTVHLEHAPPMLPLSPIAQFQLFRIVQEALANVRRHTQARHVWITLRCPAEREIQLAIADDGAGFAPDLPSAQAGVGLTVMRERAESLGGSFALTSAPGCGTQIVIRVPAQVRRPPGEGLHAPPPR